MAEMPNALLHPTTNLKAAADRGSLVVTRAKGVRVFDASGKDYIEGLSGLWCVALGHGDEELAEVAAEQIRTLSYATLFGGKAHEGALALSQKLVEMAPFPAAKVFFGQSGSDANDTQIKLIRYYNNLIGRPAKKKIVALDRAYHGVTIGAASLTGLPAFHKQWDLPMPGVLRVGCPYHYIFAGPGEGEDAFTTRLAGELDALIEAEGPDTVAAFIAEPVMGAGGVIIPPAGYFAKIQSVLGKHDVLMIDDEVITGFGRTGAAFGCETMAMTPDTMTIAKGMSSGYAPISGVLIPQDIYDACVAASGELGVFGHGFTYSGHPLSTGIALKTLEIYDKRDVFGHVRRIAPHFERHIRALAQHPLVGDARSVGLIGGVQLMRDRDSRTPYAAADGVGPYLADTAAVSRGVLLRASNDCLCFAPPLVITEAELDEMFARVKAALDDTLHWLSGQGLAPR